MATFRVQLSARCGIDVPGNAFVAMDFHLDWLHAALARTFDGLLSGEESQYTGLHLR